uniref:Uncharacterized protein n=1 Tax=Arundo donax TaxID=35708 RepID=A0A0A9EZ04_ARUDO
MINHYKNTPYASHNYVPIHVHMQTCPISSARNFSERPDKEKHVDKKKTMPMLIISLPEDQIHF